MMTKPVKDSEKAGLKVNLWNTKYMTVTRTKEQVKKLKEMCYGENKYKIVKSFCSLGSMINDDNDASQEIKAKEAAVERCYYSLKTVMRSRILSQKCKILIDRIILKSIDNIKQRLGC